MAVIITCLLCNFVNIYSTYYFIDNFLQKNRVSKRGLFYAYSIYYIITAIMYSKSYNISYNIIANLTFGFFMGLLYKSSMFKKILASVFIYILKIASDVFTVMIVSLITKSPYSVIMFDSYFVILGLVICASSQFVIIKLLIPLFRSHETELPLSYWLAVFLIPSGSIYILHSMNTQYIDGGIQDLPFILITIGILLAINILVFFLYNKLIKDEEIKYENILLHQQNNAYENQSLLIHEFENRFNGEKHDMKNHLASIKRFIEQEQLDEALKYIVKLIGKTKEIGTGSNSGDTVIDAMVDSKLYLANRQNTKFHVLIKIAQPLDMDQVDLTTILCNLLDNALEACTKLPKDRRQIWFQLSYQHAVLSIFVNNTYNPETIDIRDGKVYTTKEDKSLHGIGLRRVQQTVDKYSGMFEYCTSENGEDSIFTADIILYLHKEV
ncbi:MAG: sensor histidine kinase [Lachnospiraceae bacterium]